MSSPIGHALAGIALAWGADLVPGIRSWRTAPSSASWYERAGAGLTLTCAVLAAAPDLDLFFGRFHRTMTHSLISLAVVAGAAGLVAGRARLPRLARGAMPRIVIMCVGDASSARLAHRRSIHAAWHSALVAVRRQMVHFRVGHLPGERTSPTLQRGDHEKKRGGHRPGRRHPGTDRRCAVASTGKSPGRTSVRADRPRPFDGVADTDGTSGRQTLPA